MKRFFRRLFRISVSMDLFWLGFAALLMPVCLWLTGCGNDSDLSTRQSAYENTTTETAPAATQSASAIIRPEGMMTLKFQGKGDLDAGIAFAGGILFVGNDEGLHAIDAVSGQEKWNVNTGEWIQSTPRVLNGVVYFASNNHPQGEKTGYHVYALDSGTGKEIWRSSVPSDIFRVEAADGIVYAASTENISAFDASSGELKWQVDHGAYEVVAGKVPNLVMAVDQKLAQPVTLYAIDSTSGQEKWIQEAGDGAPVKLDAKSNLVYLEIQGGMDNRKASQSAVIAYDSNTGMEKWRVNSGELKTRPNDAMEAMLPFELQNGNLCFFFQNISMPSSRQAKPQDISADTTLFVINADNGAEEANYKVSLPAMVFNQQQGPPAFSNGYAYLISFDTSMINDEKISYTLSAISMQNGMEEWSVPVMDSPQALLSVAGVFDGRIYLASLGRATVWEIR